MFFESPHNPYEFPPEAEYTKDYIDPFVATKVSSADGPRIFNRAANCARHLDMCLEKVYNILEEKDLLKNTIVVIAGDHGEEFYERGYLGHSSSFVNEQTKTTLILYYPGITPGEYTHLSSHLDIVPMLAPLFGVKNDPADYSCGFDLLSPEKPRRKYALIANWDQVFFAGEKYKSLIPQDAMDYAKQVATDSNDNPLDDVDPFYQEYKLDLINVQNDLNRFSAQEADDHDDAERNSTIVFAIIAAAAAVVFLAAFFQRKRFKKSA
jgi:membrane-anchored protein YejM (alkaline phosphatase superfamily)